MSAKYCKLTNDQVIWIETEKDVAINKFLSEEDHKQSYLAMFDGKKRFRDAESLGDVVKQYAERLKKFINVPPYMHAYLDKNMYITHISDSPTEHEGKHVQLATMTAKYYFENNVPLSPEVEEYIK